MQASKAVPQRSAVPCRVGIVVSQSHGRGQSAVEIMVGELGETKRGTDHCLAFVRQSQRILVATEQARELKPEQVLKKDKQEITAAAVAKLGRILVIGYHRSANKALRSCPAGQAPNSFQHREPFRWRARLRVQDERPMLFIHAQHFIQGGCRG